MRAIRFIFIFVAIVVGSNTFAADFNVAIASSESDPTNASPIPVTITFDISVADFIESDISVTNGSISNFSGSGTEYTMEITPSGEGAVTVDVPAGVARNGADQNLAGTFSIDYDITPPSIATAVVSSGSGTIAVGGSMDITVTETGSETGLIVASATINSVDVSGTFSDNTDGSYTFTYVVNEGDEDQATGSIPFSIQMEDVAGNRTGAQTSYTTANAVGVDASTPSAPGTPDLTDGSDNGISSSDNLTNVTTPTFNGAGAEVGSTVKIYSDQDGMIGSGSEDGSGNWSITTSITTIGAHNITATATDAAGNESVESTSALTITIDITPSSITSTNFPTSPPKYEATDLLSFDLNWDENVYVSGGTPSFPIILDEGGTKAVEYTGGSGTQTLTFEYTVVSGDKDDPSGIEVTGLIALNGATINDISGNDAELVFTGGSTSIKIDAKQPGITDVVVPDNGYYNDTETLDFYVTFNKVVTVSGVPYIPVTLASGSVNADYTSMTDNGSTSTLLFRYAVSTGDIDLSGIEIGTDIVLTGGATIKEGKNNAFLTLTGVDPLTGIIVDAVLPTLTSVGIVSDNGNSSGTYAREGEQITLSFTGSETLTAKPTVTIAGNAIASSSVTNPSGNNWEVVYPMGVLDVEGVVQFTIDFSDLAGNTGSPVTTTTNSSYITYFRTQPTLASVSIASNHTNPNRANIGSLITIAFSSDRELDDVTASIFGSPATVNNVGDLYNWTATYTTQSGDLEGPVPFSIDFYDMPLNHGDQVSVTTDGSSVIFDKTPPQLNSVTIKSDNINSDYVGDGGIVTLSITGSEGLENSPVVTINGHTATVTKVSGSSVNWKASYVMGSAGADSDGNVIFTVDFVDFSGNNGVQVAATTDGSNVTFDKTPPSLLTVSIVSNNSNSTSYAKPGDEVIISFTSDDDIENVAARIGSEAKSMIVSSSSATIWTAEYTLPTSGLTEGDLSLTISFKDYAGNQVTHGSGTTDGSSVTFDKTAPPAPSKPDLISDYGVSDTDNITYEINPEFFGAAESYTTVRLYSNVNGLIGTVTASDTSTFQVFSSILDQGSHIITATATDGPGNVSPVSSSLTITIDNTPPAKPGTPDMDAGSDTGIFNNDNITSVNTPTVAGISETNCLITVYSGALLLGTANADIFGVWSFTTPLLSEGIHSITVSANDPAGNMSLSASDPLVITIDQTPPATSAEPLLEPGSDTGIEGDNYTRDTTPLLKGTAENSAFIRLYSDLDGVIGSGNADGTTGAWSVVAGNLSDGIHLITFTATDAAGNVSSRSDTLLLTIDTSAPDKPDVPGLDPFSDTGASDRDNITNIHTPKINGQAEANAYVDIYLDNSVISTVITDSAGVYSYIFGALTDEKYSIRVVCKDPAGNVSVTSDNLFITVDRALPILSSAVLASSNVRPYLARVGDKATLSFIASESVLQPTVVIDGKSVVISGGPTAWSATRSLDGSETEGSLVFSIQYTDIAGNTGAIHTFTTDASEVFFDKTAPDLTSINIASDHINADKARVGSEVNIFFTSTETIENVGVKINGKVTLADTISANNWQARGYLATSDPEGDVAFTIHYKDFAGNAGVLKTATTDASAVTFDKTTPSYTLVSIYSDNSNPAYAVDGDLVSLEFTTSETVETPGVFINGLPPDAITGGPVSWLATRTVTAGENEGTIPFTINISDLAGNTPNTRFTTTDGTAVVFDDSNPGISSVTVTSGVYKVGDVLSLLIRSDDITYTGTTVEVNGKPQLLNNNLNNNYTIDYLIEEGDAELNEAGSVPVVIVLQDPAGLTTSRTEAASLMGTITIDSRTPRISAFSSNAEGSGNVIIGDSIIFTLIPETAEAGLLIQPVSYNGAALNWATTDGAVYKAIYVVQENDPEQTSPLQLSQVILSDDAGNADTVVYASIDKEIYTAYPSAKITGSTSKCDYGQTVPIIFQFTGRKPFTFSYSNGADIIGPIVRDGFTYTINEDRGAFTLVSLTDSTGNNVTDALENATIDVVSLPVVTTDYFNSPYNIESPADKLSQYVVQEDKRNGIFSAAEGIGYSNGSYYFYPGNIPAGLLDKDIEIIYTYTDGITGCFTKDTNRVFVSSTPVRIVGLQSVYCEDLGMVTIGGTLPAQHSGRFEVFDADSNLVVFGWTQTDSVTLTFDTRQLPAGDYMMKYTAYKLPEFAETNFSSTRDFSIEAIRRNIQLTGLSDAYCFDSLSSSIPVRVNFEPGLGDIGNFFGSDVFTVIPGEHNARFELRNAKANNVYTLNYIYKSINGCIADTVSRTVQINPLPELAFELDNNYNYDQTSIQLSGTPDDLKYNFTGEGVSNNTLFTSAARINSSIVITFSGSDDKGCYNEVIDTTIIYQANETIEGISAEGVYCYEELVLDISCRPNISDTITGTFRSKRNALEPDGRNRARYYFNRIGSGADTVYFDYDVLGTSYTVKKAVFIDSIGEVSITSSTANFDYCHSEPLVQYVGNQNYTLGGQGEFEYLGSSGEAEITRSSSTAIYPVDEVPGTYSIGYSYTSSRGCSAETSHVINIYPEPLIDFSQPISCPDLTSPVPFTNHTTFSGDESELDWEWRFEGGLPITEKSPVYTFQSIGVKQVSLTVTTDKGCAVSRSREYTIGNFAQADFKWDNECNTGEQVTLTSTSKGGIPKYGGYIWKMEGAVISEDRTVVHQFSDIGGYDIRLIYTSNDGCIDSVTKTLVIQPYIRITEDLADQAYFEDFESGSELYTWQARGLTKADTTRTDTTRWILGVPEGDVISMAASGNHSWYTRLIDRNDVENSEVVSPCFDLSGLEKPMIKLNIWSSSEFKRDGAVMQYSTDYGNTWDNLGDVNEGVNWFNSEDIQSQPGGLTQYEGWNDVHMEDWTSARHSLDFLKGATNVRFRIAYAADGGGVEDVDGFAFDDVWIGERQQNVLMEYFTNSNASGSVEGNSNILDYEASRVADLVPIHYHTGSPAGDPLFSDYEEGPSARVFYYGVSFVPEVISNGFIRSGLDNKAVDLFDQEVDVESLNDPLVSIDLNVSRSSAEVNITALRDLTGESMVLFVAVVKDSIEVDGVCYYNVLRKFLPDPAGINLSTNGFANGETITESIALNLGSSSMFIGSKLVVFVQNTSSKRVYQSVWSDFSGLTSLLPDNINNLVDIYPNPVTDRLFIESEYEIRRLVITDMTGRVVRIMEPDQVRVDLPVEEYKYGVYMIKGITDRGEFIKKFIKQ